MSEKEIGRLATIDDMASANVFLPGYLETHNRRFAVAAMEQDDAHWPDGRPY